MDQPGVAADIFLALGQRGVNVEMITTTATGRKRVNIAFVVLESDIDNVLKILEAIKHTFGAEKISVEREFALITIYGSRLATTPGIAGKVFAKLTEQGINIDMISASLSVLSIVVNKDKAQQAVQAIQSGFAV